MSPRPFAGAEVQRILALVPWIVAHPGTAKADIAQRFGITIDQLDEEGRERVRTANLEFVAQNGIAAIEANVLYALARKPHDWHAGNQGQ